jgi:hypothetical protein
MNFVTYISKDGLSRVGNSSSEWSTDAILGVV